jgi:hypothetical protein
LARADVTRDEHAARIVACDDALAIGTDLTAAASPRLDVAWGVTRRRLFNGCRHASFSRPVPSSEMGPRVVEKMLVTTKKTSHTRARLGAVVEFRESVRGARARIRGGAGPA